MKRVIQVFAILLILSGTIWFFQGINLLPGTFMRGQIEWAIYGAIAVIIGVFILRRGR